jgi:hypothetical protein
VNVAQAPVVELFDGPIARRAELRRISQPRPVVIRQVEQRLHDGRRRSTASTAGAAASGPAATRSGFRGLNFVDDIQVDPLHRLLGDQHRRNGDKKRDDKKCFT